MSLIWAPGWVPWRCAGSWSLVLFVAALSNRFPKSNPVFQLRPLKVFKSRDTSIMASALSELHRDQTAICLRLTCSRNTTMRLSGHAAGIGSVAPKDFMRQRPVATLPQLFYWGDLRAHCIIVFGGRPSLPSSVVVDVFNCPPLGNPASRSLASKTWRPPPKAHDEQK